MTYDQRVKPATSGMEREARQEKQRIEARHAMEDRQQADAAFRANFERLKAERLQRETDRSG
jgi:hypothetical protein